MDGLVQAGASGSLRDIVHRDLGTLFSVPGGDATARDVFLEMLGLAHRTDPIGAPVADGGFARAALMSLALLAGAVAATVLILRARAHR